jgi:hypothetical protein
MIVQLVKKFPAVYGIEKFTAVFTTARIIIIMGDSFVDERPGMRTSTKQGYYDFI